jgi:hypothetical protein
LFRYRERVIYLDAEISDGALDLRVAEQELNGTHDQGIHAILNRSSPAEAVEWLFAEAMDVGGRDKHFRRARRAVYQLRPTHERRLTPPPEKLACHGLQHDGSIVRCT